MASCEYPKYKINVWLNTRTDKHKFGIDRKATDAIAELRKKSAAPTLHPLLQPLAAALGAP